jgi:hypothetical protein
VHGFGELFVVIDGINPEQISIGYGEAGLLKSHQSDMIDEW